MSYSKDEDAASQSKRHVSDDQWRRGLSLSDWAEWRDPVAYSQLTENWIWVHSVPALPGDDLKFERRRQAARRLRGHLRDDAEAGVVRLGRPPDTVGGEIEFVTPVVLADLIDGMEFAGIRGDEANFAEKWITVRVYLPLGPSTESESSNVGTVAEGQHLAQQGERAIDRRGAKTRYDWDAFWVEVCRRVHVDGIPAKQSEIEDQMKTWCLEKWDIEPATSTIRAKISKLFSTLELRR